MNPFEQRATEYLRDDEAFLSIIASEPLMTHFGKPAEDNRLYDRLTIVVGTPGSGKTTLARLFQFRTLTTLLGNRDATGSKPLLDALTGCRATDGKVPLVLGARIPLESEYREFWEFPYEDELKIGLMTSLMQARSVLVWLRSLENAGYDIDDIQISPRSDATAALVSVGGTLGSGLLERAREVEAAIYRVSAALIPPNAEEIQAAALSPYRPFDVIDKFQLKNGTDSLSLRPLVIFDDAHSLHPDQFAAMRDWLAQREIRVSRWIQTRLDSLKPKDVLELAREHSGEQVSREVLVIRMQGAVTRLEERSRFAKVANEMTRRYLGRMDVFSRRQIQSLGDMLSTGSPSMSEGKFSTLSSSVDASQDACKVTAGRRAELETTVDDYLGKSMDIRDGEDVRLAMINILIHRYAKRTPQMGLFGDTDTDPEPARPLIANRALVDAARVFLLREYDRPYYFGMQALSRAASENAELLLQFSAELVARLETLCIRRRPPTLDASTQHKLLTGRAKRIISEWDFPFSPNVRSLCDAISDECIEKNREPNASLNGGATGVGIPMASFDALTRDHPALAQSLKFGAAYNAFSLLPDRSVKGRDWLIIDLAGPYRLKSNMTLNHGNFVERTLEDLLRMHGGRF